MTVDPTDPETFEEGTVPANPVEAEASEGDAAEQQADLAPLRDEPVPPERSTDEADEADRAEQSRVVALDEDDYR
ncbi:MULTISPECIES: hypothetical protein [Streptomyces]|uniref:DUF5709 domain-containing protein n=1 Tax=Streptomyces albus (strain ATCC 21838 / DSM 41398 / FERM P-419 / JCM 4703 / NBRC 107858) TaxID=1081613 RepID=A0A0B5EUZ5_STRA4|nr:hypothetical protein [Streptomyces sp. SCSIO ZS0520]AJE82516.1 hypothetical protein SLNWT_2140 [Streptomyces albus]AOU76831.1 hypothetical protein SLNHY_2140 [Streptomyces albus]AYN32609.1 hypothetical protein DUI70_2106 [Streptomyces albus]